MPVIRTAAVAASLAFSACTAAPSAAPPKKNSPPRIVGQTPRDNTTTVQVGSTCNPEFSILVHDDDLGDTLNDKWWVDATQGYVATVSNSEIVGGSVAPTGELERVVKAPKAVVNRLNDGQQHRVEVFATDGFFDPDSLEPFRPPLDPPVLVPRDGGCLPGDGGCFEALTDEAYRVSFMWLVTVQPCP